MSLKHNLRRSFQNVKKDMTEIKQRLSMLENNSIAQKLEKIEKELEDVKEAVKKTSKKKR